MASTQEQIDALHHELAEQRLIVTTMKATVDAQSEMITELYKALMVPAPGETNALLFRMAKVTNNFEWGKKTGDFAVRLGQITVAIGLVIGGFYAMLHLGDKQ